MTMLATASSIEKIPEIGPDRRTMVFHVRPGSSEASDLVSRELERLAANVEVSTSPLASITLSPGDRRSLSAVGE